MSSVISAPETQNTNNDRAGAGNKVSRMTGKEHGTVEHTALRARGNLRYKYT